MKSKSALYIYFLSCLLSYLGAFYSRMSCICEEIYGEEVLQTAEGRNNDCKVERKKTANCNSENLERGAKNRVQMRMRRTGRTKQIDCKVAK